MVKLEHYEGFTDSKKLVYLEENKPIFKQLKNIDYDLALVFANGRQVDKFYTPKENDLLVIRSVAGSLTTAGLIISGVSLIVGVVAGVYAYKSNAELKKIEKELEASTNASRNINKAPYLRGASNTLATGQTQPFIIGTHLFTPYILNSGKNENYKSFTTIDGTDGKRSFYNIVLEGGFNNQIIQKVFADDIDLVTLGGNTPQNKKYSLTKSTLFNSDNNYIEIVQDGTGFKSDDKMNKVIVEKKYNAVMYKKPTNAIEDGTSSDQYKELIYSLEKNTMSADVVILLNGLCYFDKNGVKQSSTRNIKLDYSYNYNELLAKGDEDINTKAVWLPFNDFAQVSSVSDQQVTKRTAVYKYELSGFINESDSEILASTRWDFNYGDKTSFVYVSGDTDRGLLNNADKIDFSVSSKSKSGLKYTWTVLVSVQKDEITSQVDFITYSNTFTRNTLSQLRFEAHKDFSADSINLNYPVAIRLSSDDRKKADGQEYNDVYLDFVKSYIFDEDDFNKNNRLTNAKVIDDKSAGLSTLIGLHIEATEANEEKLKSIQVITSGVARTWNGSAWSTSKSATSNPASWLLEILTSDKHTPSKVSDNEIDLDSLGAWYEFCNTNGLSVNYVITTGVTKQSILELITNAGRGVLYRNIYGKIAVGIDGEKENAQGILNEQNLVSFEYTKEMKREPDGLNIEYIDADAGYQKNNFVVMFNQYDADGNLDVFGKNRSADSIILSHKLEGVTSWDNAIKHARYLMKCQRLRPKTCKAVVGMEGEYYIPMTKFLVQHPSLKIGLGNAEIKDVIYNNNNTAITGLELYDAVQLDTENDFNIIIQCVGTKDGVEYCTPLAVAVEGYNGRTTTIEFKTSLSADSNAIPHANDVLSYGYDVDTITSPMLLTGIENNGNGYTLTLVDYNEDIFTNDSVIPEYQPNITQPQTPVINPVEVITTEDIAAKLEDNNEKINNINVPVIVKLFKRAKQKPTATGITSDAEYDYSNGSLTFESSQASNGWSQFEPDGTDPLYMTVASISGNGTVTISKTSWASPVLYVKNGEDGENSAEVYSIVPNYNIVTRYQDGTLSSDKINFKFYKSNESSRGEVSVYYVISVSQTVGAWSTYATGTGIQAEVNTKDIIGIKCDIYANSSSSVPLDSETVAIVNEGTGAINVSLSNNNVSIPCDSDGNPTTLEGTNSLVYVLCGATPLNYGDASVSGNFDISLEYENIEVVSRARDLDVVDNYLDKDGEEYYDEDGNYYTSVSYFELPNITGITQNKGSRKVIVRGTSLDGTKFELTTVQTFSKVMSGSDGSNGINCATVILYQRSSSVPSKPTATLNYKFAKPPIMSWGSSGSSNGWQFEKPAITEDKLPLYEIRSTALSETINDTISPSEWGAVQITQKDDGLSESEVEALLETTEENIINSIKPVFDLTIDGNTFVVNENGIITKAQTVTVSVTCNRNGVSVPFKFDSVEVPNGFKYIHEDDKLYITSLVGSVLSSGKFKVTVKTCDVSYLQYTDETGDTYNDEKNDIYSLVSFDVNAISSKTFEIAYTVTKGGKYYKKINNIANLPTDALIGDYFTFTGSTVTSAKSLQGRFVKSCIYSFDGEYWCEETNGEHLSRCLSDVLSIVDEDLGNNNSTAYEYLDHLTANDIFAKKVTAKQVEAGLIVSKETITNKFISIDDSLEDLGERQTSAETNINNILDDYLTSQDISDMETKTELAQTLQSYVTGNTLTQTLARYVTATDLESKGYLTDEEEAERIITALSNSTGKTIIEGGLIKTDLIINDVTMSSLVETTEIKAITGRITKIESDYVTTTKLEADYTKTSELESKYASIEYLEGGDATFKGDVKANSLELLNTLNINNGALTIDPDGTLNATKGRFEAGLGFVTELPPDQGGHLNSVYGAKHSISMIFVFKQGNTTSTYYGGLILSRADIEKGMPAVTPIGSLHPNFDYNVLYGNSVKLIVNNDYLKSGEKYKVVELIIF